VKTATASICSILWGVKSPCYAGIRHLRRLTLFLQEMASAGVAVSLIVDVRERALIAALTRIGTPFTTAGLKVGDVLIQSVADEQPLLIIERKSLADFAASNEDGRYREQRARLMAARGGGASVLYIIEGRYRDFIGSGSGSVSGSTSVHNHHGRTTEAQLRRLTTRLLLRYGMPVLHTEDITDTATWLTTLVAQTNDDTTVFQPEGGMATATAAAMTHMTAALSMTKKANRDAASIATGMLGAVPGLGAKRIQALLAEHSIADLVAACSGSSDSLGELVVGGKRLGPALGALLRDALLWREEKPEGK